MSDMPRVVVCTWFDERYYRIELGDQVKYFVSTTTKLQASPKPYLAKWRGDVGNREADLRLYEAGEKGKRIHYACSLFLSGGAVVYNPRGRYNYTAQQLADMAEVIQGEVFALQDQDEMWQVAKFRKWMEVTGAQLVEKDFIVWDVDTEEAGTIDFVFKIKEGEYQIAGKKPIKLEGGIYIADLKTGSQISDEYYLQLASYTTMFEKCQPGMGRITGGLIIHTNAKIKNGIEGLTTDVRPAKELMEKDYPSFRNVAAIWDRQNEGHRPQMLEFPSLITLRNELLEK